MARNGLGNRDRQSAQVETRGSRGFRAVLVATVMAITLVGWAAVRFQVGQTSDLPAEGLHSVADKTGSTTAPPDTPGTQTQPAASSPPTVGDSQLGTLYLDMRQDSRYHLWAYAPGDASPKVLMAGDWDDRDPKVSPEGSRLAFASRRGGFWDLYVLDLDSGLVQRLTDTPGYEGHPTWSPDGLWLAYEAYHDGQFDVWITPTDAAQAPIQLTNHPGQDMSPDWEPGGRRIAFVSDREGEFDIFLADLDDPENRFVNLTGTSTVAEAEPAFSPDGQLLAYSLLDDGLDRITTLTVKDNPRRTVEIGPGQVPAWSPDGRLLLGILPAPSTDHLVAYSLAARVVSPAALPALAGIRSVDWSARSLPPDSKCLQGSLQSPNLLLRPDVQATDAVGDRVRVVELEGVAAPRPSLSDKVDEAFQTLRARIAAEAGWDFLATLDNAFAGINDALPPGLAYNDWLLTGRAFAFSSAAMRAGWVEVVREEIQGQMYWTVFVRANAQDGSLGEPLRARPWDFDAKFGGTAQAYDEGGALRPAIPEGYYVDFTTLALEHGFERLPALPNWRVFWPAARFNEFAMTEGLDWITAMLELYPPAAIVTPTVFKTPTPSPTPTRRPTPTPWWWRWRTPTPSRTPTQIPPAPAFDGTTTAAP